MKAYCRKYTVFRTFTWYFIKTIKTWQPFETLFTKMSSSEQSETSVRKIKNSKPSLILQETRMHSSRMRNVRCKGHRGVVFSGGCLSRGYLFREGCIPACTGCGWHTSPSVNRILDTHLWKHYLSATTLRTVIILIEQHQPWSCRRISI